jgi:hypothetical protein
MECHITLKSVSLKVFEMGERKSVGFFTTSVKDLYGELGSLCLMIKTPLKLNPFTLKLNSK